MPVIDIALVEILDMEFGVESLGLTPVNQLFCTIC